MDGHQQHRLNIDGHTLMAIENNADAAGTPIIFIHVVLNSIYLQEPIWTEVLAGNPLAVKLFHRFVVHNITGMLNSRYCEPSIRLSMRDSVQLDPAFIFAYFRYMPHTNIMGWLRQITLPVTLLHGDHDPVSKNKLPKSFNRINILNSVIERADV